MTKQEIILHSLFQTHAIRVCQPDQPFWYTSGTLGPYYINTHFLYGDEQSANALLAKIESAAADPVSMPSKLAEAISTQYDREPIYRDVCDLIANRLADCSFDLISGGERRDFFFSVQAAKLLNRPHLSILKDGTMILSDDHFKSHRLIGPDDLAGKIGGPPKALHVADLVTEASSYQRAWMPFVHRAGAVMPQTLAVVDRDQGGREWLLENGTELIALARIDREFFRQALLYEQIDPGQFTMITQFMDSPIDFMRRFFREHPDFLDQQVALGGKNRERALLCREKGYAG